MHDRRLDPLIKTPEQRMEYDKNLEYFHRVQAIINGTQDISDTFYEVCVARREQAEQLSALKALPAPIVIHVQDSPELRKLLLQPKATPSCDKRHGWDLFNVDLDDEGVQRVDDGAIFRDDQAAMEHILSCQSCFQNYQAMKWQETP